MLELELSLRLELLVSVVPEVAADNELPAPVPTPPYVLSPKEFMPELLVIVKSVAAVAAVAAVTDGVAAN